MRHGDEDGATFVIPTESTMAPDAVEAWLHTALVDLPEPLRLCAALVTLDLVASARTHRAAPYVVRLSTLDQRHTLCVSVDDSTAADDARSPSTPPDSTLLLVAALSTRWGIEQRARARTTWAELTTTDPASPGELRIRTPDQSWPGPWPETP